MVKSFTHISLFELQAPVWTVNEKAKDLQAYWALRNHSKRDLLEVSRDLARLNASYELRLQENIALKEEVGRLEAALNLPELAQYEPILARINRRSLTSWWHHLVIQKGKREGVREGAAVIYGKGIVGRVKTVYTYTSIVELISSPTFRIAAQIRGDARPLTYRGLPNTAFGQPCGEILNIPCDIAMNEGDKPLNLVSSRLGGVFPDGLTIGKLYALKPGVDGLFNQAKVKLDPLLHTIREVVVLLPLDTEIER